MEIKRINGAMFRLMVINGAENLRRNYQEVDALNVFPVPDGDTGTNMKMTIEGGVSECADDTSDNIYDISKKISRGMLMGARGNSGVILSQFFRGINVGLTDQKSVNAVGLAKAFASGVQQAYKAVLTPTEGTILTVARESCERLSLIASSRMTINEFFDELCQAAAKSLQETPDKLPVLKEAGVVDSGGAGLLCILEGMKKAVNGEMLEITNGGTMNFGKHAQFAKVASEDDEFGYCTEFICQLDPAKVGNVEEFSEQVILDEISPIGNSIVIVKDGDIVKVHIHTLTPGNVLNIGQKYGEYLKLKIENMTLQHHNLATGEEEASEPAKPERPLERSKYAVVAVANGKGLEQAFMDLGANYIVSGGQTMNPSTEDFIIAFDHLNAENIIVLPNNKNIILAAEQASKIYTESNVVVIRSKSIAEGLSAVSMVDTTAEVSDNIEQLNSTIANVTSLAITYATRSTKVNGIKVDKGDFIGMMNGKLVSAHIHLSNTFKELINLALVEDKEMITVIYGQSVSKRDAEEQKRWIERTFAHVEVQLIDGGQDVYNYIISVE